MCFAWSSINNQGMVLVCVMDASNAFEMLVVTEIFYF